MKRMHAQISHFWFPCLSPDVWFFKVGQEIILFITSTSARSYSCNGGQRGSCCAGIQFNGKEFQWWVKRCRILVCPILWKWKQSDWEVEWTNYRNNSTHPLGVSWQHQNKMKTWWSVTTIKKLAVSSMTLLGPRRIVAPLSVVKGLAGVVPNRDCETDSISDMLMVVPHKWVGLFVDMLGSIVLDIKLNVDETTEPPVLDKQVKTAANRFIVQDKKTWSATRAAKNPRKLQGHVGKLGRYWIDW